MQTLRDVWDAAVRAEPKVVVVGGEAGIGKTRVVEEFLAQLPADTLTASGVCVDLGDAGAPFIPIRAILRDLVGALGEERVRTGAGSAPEALMTLVDGADAPDASEASVGRLREGFLRLLESVAADRPVVIVVEDVHWADTSTLRLLDYVARLVRDARLLLVLTARTGEMPRGHRADLAELERLRAVTRLELPPLERADVAAMAADDADADVDRLLERSGGIPFFVEELLEAGAGALPRTVSDLIATRFESLPASSQSVLRLMSVGGLRVDHQVLAEVTGTAEIDDALRPAVTAGLVVADRSGYGFRHALVREVIDGELMPGERARLHARFAAELERRSGGVPDIWDAEVSTHWMHARDDDRAFAAACRAMDAAALAFALATEAAMAERCVDLWEHVADPQAVSGCTRWEMLARAAGAHRAGGNDERALPLTEAAIQALGDDDPATLARLRNDIGLDLYRLGRARSTEWFEDALAILGDPDTPATRVLRAEILANMSASLMMKGDSPRGLAVAEQALAEGRAAGPEARAAASLGANIAGVTLIDLNRPDEALARFDEALDLAGDDWGPRVRWAINLSDSLNLLGRTREALQVAEQALEEARRRGEERGAGIMLITNSVEPMFALGQWDRAEAIIDRALRGETPMAFRRYLEHLHQWFLIWRGDLDAARAWNREIRASHDRIGQNERQVRTGTAYDEAEMRLADDDPKGAFAVLEEVIWDGGTDRPFDRLWAIAMAARAHAAMRDAGITTPRSADEIRQLLDPLRDRVGAEVWVRIAEAEIAEDPADTVARWEAAIALLVEGRGHRHLLGVGRVRQASALVRLGDRDAARAHLDLARREADALGAGLVRQMADDLATRARLDASDSVGELTAREQQVLALIAEGLTNRQIGERLYISPKTASVHVSALLRKLGAANRAEAAARAADLLGDAATGR